MASAAETHPGTPTTGPEPDATYDSPEKATPENVNPEDVTDERAPGDDEVDEWERESFPASDPPANW